MGRGGEIVIYQPSEGGPKLDVRLREETLWLTQAQMAELFQKERSVITKHMRNVFNSGELDEKSNVQIMHIPGSDKPVAFYSLDAILSVGYRINSKQGTQFRIWATKVLKEHLIKGYTVNQKRLKELKQTVRLIADNALVATTLLIAESNPREKELLTGLLVNLIDRRNA
jgi:hypothetical protein